MSVRQDDSARPQRGYSEQQLNTIKELWDAGQSAAQIAELIARSRPGITRNAIIGVVTRKGWTRSPSANAEARRTGSLNRKDRRPAKEKPARVAVVGGRGGEKTEAAVREVAKRIVAREVAPTVHVTRALLPTVELGQCRYEIRHGLFCGNPTEIRRGRRASYCPACAPRIFVKGGRL
ncbi:GcrA family cell cycle regulator [Asticcacaulis sp.]|uniref:GcrA family cell cycle regulator n=1 Tax=Asticcacaulis sp. TaxID=1872648 RepID=UPI0031DD52BE